MEYVKHIQLSSTKADIKKICKMPLTNFFLENIDF